MLSKKVKIKKKYWEKGKSKFLAFREELQANVSFGVSGKWLRKQNEIIQENIIRRAKMKINQLKHPKSYYADCFINLK